MKYAPHHIWLRTVLYRTLIYAKTKLVIARLNAHHYFNRCRLIALAKIGELSHSIMLPLRICKKVKSFPILTWSLFVHMCAVNFYSCWIISHPCSSLLGSWFLFLFFLFLYLFLLLSLVIHLLFSMELGLNGKGSCAFAPTKAMLANSKLDCSSVMTLAVGQGSYTSCGEDTNKCSQTCKDTIDKVYSVCKTSDAKWELSGSELTVSTGVMSARENYGDECY